MSVEQEQASVRACIPYLKNGIENFKTLVTLILEYDESKHQTTRDVILKGKESLEKSDSAVSAELSKVDEVTENLTARKQRLDQEQTYKMQDLVRLDGEKQHITDCLENCKVSLDNARKSMDSAQETLAHYQRKKEESETVRDVGRGIMFIPIIGTIAGAIMIGVSQQDLENAEFQVREAEGELQSWEREIDKYSSMLQEKKREKKQNKEEIAECSWAIEQIKQSLERVATQRKNITLVQAKIRSAVNMLGTVHGRANVLMIQTKSDICLPIVINILGEIIKLLLDIPKERKYELLNDPDVKATILSFQEIYTTVSAIDDQQTLKDIQFI